MTRNSNGQNDGLAEGLEGKKKNGHKLYNRQMDGVNCLRDAMD